MSMIRLSGDKTLSNTEAIQAGTVHVKTHISNIESTICTLKQDGEATLNRKAAIHDNTDFILGILPTIYAETSV
jgi:hypothetical protein